MTKARTFSTSALCSLSWASTLPHPSVLRTRRKEANPQSSFTSARFSHLRVHLDPSEWPRPQARRHLDGPRHDLWRNKNPWLSGRAGQLRHSLRRKLIFRACSSSQITPCARLKDRARFRPSRSQRNPAERPMADLRRREGCYDPQILEALTAIPRERL